MIWRKGRDPKIVEGWEMPSLPCRDLLGRERDPMKSRLACFGWSLGSLNDQEVWRRLAQGDFGEDSWTLGLVVVERDRATILEAQSAVPPSEHGSFLVWEDAESLLEWLICPDSLDVCAVYQPASKLLILGNPGEKAWEAMAEALSSQHCD